MITSPSLDRRYLPDVTSRLRAHGATGVARDRLTGRKVFLKRGQAGAIARELTVSLIL